MKKSPNSGNFSKNGRSFCEVFERVRYSETDQMGVAHNKNYFEWFEIGRTEFCRAKKLPYKTIEKHGIYLVVAESSCQYLKPLTYDEQIVVRVRLAEALPKKIVFEYQIHSRDRKRLAAKGKTVHVPTDSKAKVTRLPEEWLRMLTG